MRITFVIDRFHGERDPEGVVMNELALWSCLRNLVDLDVQYLRAHPETPSLYDLHDAGKVRYQEEPEGEEDWCDIPTVIRQGWGDCEDIACWRVAELMVRYGVPVEPFFTVVETPDGDLYHILVQYPPDATGGRLKEDPCRRVGMR